MALTFQYQLDGIGWSKCTLAVGEAKVDLTASYVSDALCSLLEAVCGVLDGRPEATAKFDEEPGQYRWRLFRADGDLVRILILEFRAMWSDEPDSEGKPLFDARCSLTEFATAVLSECERLLAEHGRDGYRELWDLYDFPDPQVEMLRRLLGKQDDSA